MHGYPIGIDLVRFAFVLGIVASIVIYDRFGLTPGSLVAAGYIGIFVGEPGSLAMTCAIALVAHWVTTRVLPRFIVVYGGTRFTILLVISVGLQSLALLVSRVLPAVSYGHQSVPLLAGIGFVVPALLAHDMRRQGVRRTVAAAAGAGLVVAAVVWTIVLVLPGAREAQTALDPSLAFDPRLVPVAVFFSVLGARSLQDRYRLRSGGLVSVAYLALIVTHPLGVLCLLAAALATFLVVRFAIMPFGIVFGRRKFALMLSVGALWGWLIVLVLPDFAPSFRWVPLVALVVPGLLGNDFERAGISRTLIGAALNTSFVLPATLLVWRLLADRGPLSTPILVGWVVVASVVVVKPRLGSLGVSAAAWWRRRWSVVPAAGPARPALAGSPVLSSTVATALMPHEWAVPVRGARGGETGSTAAGATSNRSPFTKPSTTTTPAASGDLHGVSPGARVSSGADRSLARGAARLLAPRRRAPRRSDSLQLALDGLNGQLDALESLMSTFLADPRLAGSQAAPALPVRIVGSASHSVRGRAALAPAGGPR
ncbi:MAG: poly-gamma-glutamate biosynthesis protein PgsC/CapC [Thermoleophilia bacterium]|nr:poly-gamma-glutamate biosynthesis protein PgsC/CapC [Thermoleophilia bacterium]MDH5332532.1 poly-gamma-glutamate biosynthesis protein PgsC/CapC [Thermoleophilia bacterium]